MRRSLLAPLLLAAACSAAPVAPPREAAPAAPPPAAPRPTAPASAAPAPPSRPAARVGDPMPTRLGVAVDCRGLDLGAWAVDRGLLGVCGAWIVSAAVFTVSPEGAPRLAPEIFKDLSLLGARSSSTLGVVHVRGPDLDHLDARVYEIGQRSGMTYHYRRTGKRWTQAPLDPDDVGDDLGFDAVEVNHRVLAARADDPGRTVFRYLDDAPAGWLPAEAKAPGCDTPVTAFSALRLRGKDLWGIGVACGKLAAQRWTVGAADTTVVPLGIDAEPGASVGLVQHGATWLYVMNSGRSIALFDGTRWQGFPELPSGERLARSYLARGRIWIEAQHALLRVAGDRLEELPVPGEYIQRLEVSDDGEIGLATDAGVFALGADDAWHRFDLPAALPEGTPMRVDHLAGRWVVWLEAKGDPRRLLVVEGTTGKPVSIEDPPVMVSPIAHVTPLTRDCDEPFAMLYKLAKTAPRDYDYPATREALKGQTDLLEGRYAEVEAFGERHLVAQFKGPRARAKLALLVKRVADKVKGAKPQLLCADRVPGGLPISREVKMR